MKKNDSSLPTLLFLLLLMIRFFFAPPIVWAAPAPSDSHYGGTLVLGTVYPPQNFNPLQMSAGVSSTLMSVLFNRLVRIDSQGRVQPDLAEHWQWSHEGLELVFKLRAGVKFHDGIELTSEDVVFTFEQILDPANNSPFRNHFAGLTKIEALDPYTVRFTVDQKFPLLIYKIAQREIIPQHYYGTAGKGPAFTGEHPLGTGPFRFEHWDKSRQQVRLEYFPEYFEGRPYLDAISVRVYPDVSKLWAAFMRQEVDLLKFIGREDFEIIEKDQSFKAYKVRADLFYVLVYNLADRYLQSKNLRLAIAHAINVEGLVRNIGAGDGLVSLGPLIDPTDATDADVRERLVYDPNLAARLLKEDGWADSDRNGILEKDGHPLEIRVLVNERQTIERKIIKYLRQNLAEVGIKLVVVLIDPVETANDERFTKFRAQAELRFNYGPGNEFDTYEAALYWYSGIGSLQRNNGYHSKAFDRLFDQFKKDDSVERKSALVRAMNRTVYEDQPVCFLFYPVNYFGVSAKVLNAESYFTPFMPGYTLKDWYRSH